MASPHDATTSRFPIDNLEKQLDAQVEAVVEPADEVTKPFERAVAPLRRKRTRRQSRRLVFPAVTVDEPTDGS